MLNRLSLIGLIVISLSLSNIAGAQNNDSSKPVAESTLAKIKLPEGAAKIDDSDVPEHIRTALANLLARINTRPPSASKAKYLPVASEVIAYPKYGNNKPKSAQVIKKIEAALQTAGWKYEPSKKGIAPPSFLLTRTTPEIVRTTGFFISKGTALFFVLAEIIPDVTGKWNMKAEVNGNFIPVTLELKQANNIVSGTFSSHIGGGTIREIKIRGNSLEALAKIEVQKRLVEIKLGGTIDGDKMNGTLFVEGLPDIAFTATKAG